MNRKLLALTTAVALLAATGRLAAQDLPTGGHQTSPDDASCWAISTGAGARCGFTVPVNVSIPHIIQMWTNDNSAEFGMIGGWGYANAPQIQAEANTDWHIDVQAATPFFKNAAGAPSTKSASTLFIENPLTHMFFNVGSPVMLISGSRGYTNVPGHQLYTYTNLLTDDPGDYSIDLLYTMTGS